MIKSYLKDLRTRTTKLFAAGKTELIISELKNDLKAADQRYAMLSQAINDAICDWNMLDNSIQWNHGLFELYGYDEKNVEHNYPVWLSNIHEEDKAEVLKSLADTFLNHGGNWKSIYRYKCRNGSFKYTYSRGHIVYEGVKPVRMISAMQDIDERMLAMQEIEKLSLVASKTDNLVIITDANENIEWVNEGFVKRTGYSLNEVVGKTPRILQGIETQRPALDQIRLSIKAGESITQEVLNYTKDGTKLWLKININPVYDESNKIIRFVAVETDVTPNKEYEKTITTIAGDLTNLIATANTPVFGIDRNGCINEWNERASEITGFVRSEIFNKKFIDALVEENHRIKIRENLDEVFLGTPLSNLEVPIITKEKNQIIILLNATPRKNLDNEVESLFLVGQDITELAEYRQTLEESVQERTTELQNALKKEKELVTLKSRFASMVSHEFRTPLSTIKLSANHIKKYRDKLQPEEIDKKLDIIRQQVEHMTLLLEDILIIGKSEEGKIQISKVTINIVKLLDEIREDVENQFKNTHTICCSFDLLHTDIEADRGLLRNIFVNLLSNAIKFSPGKSKVFLRCYEKKGSIIFDIQDEGIGIPDADHERIFLPFDRGSNVSTIPGTGLGLSIVTRAVATIGGSISVKKASENGTVFSVVLPLDLPTPAVL
jgi:PAS domain S-box-containing protein